MGVRATMTFGYFIDLEERGKKLNSSDCWCIIVFPYSLCKMSDVIACSSESCMWLFFNSSVTLWLGNWIIVALVDSIDDQIFQACNNLYNISILQHSVGKHSTVGWGRFCTIALPASRYFWCNLLRQSNLTLWPKIDKLQHFMTSRSFTGNLQPFYTSWCNIKVNLILQKQGWRR